MTEVESATQAARISRKYIDEVSLTSAPVVEEVTLNDSDEWEVLVYRLRLPTKKIDPYTITVDAETGNITEVIDMEPEKGIIVSKTRKLIDSFTDAVLSVLFLVREIKGKNR